MYNNLTSNWIWQLTHWFPSVQQPLQPSDHPVASYPIITTHESFNTLLEHTKTFSTLKAEPQVSRASVQTWKKKGINLKLITATLILTLSAPWKQLFEILRRNWSDVKEHHDTQSAHFRFGKKGKINKCQGEVSDNCTFYSSEIMRETSFFCVLWWRAQRTDY